MLFRSEAACEMARTLAVDYLELRTPDVRPDPPGFARQALYATFTHPIDPDEEAMRKSFPRDVRRMIRLGSRNGLSVEFGGEELLDAFYAVYATSVRNLGTPVFPRRLFASFLRQFPEASEILLVRQGARIAGAVLSFYFRDTVLPYYGGAYPAVYRAGVNNFM